MRLKKYKTPQKQENLKDSEPQQYKYTAVKHCAVGDDFFPAPEATAKSRALEKYLVLLPFDPNVIAALTKVLCYHSLLSQGSKSNHRPTKTLSDVVRRWKKIRLGGPTGDSESREAARLQCAEMSKCPKGRRSDSDWYFPGGDKSHSDIEEVEKESFLDTESINSDMFSPVGPALFCLEVDHFVF